MILIAGNQIGRVHHAVAHPSLAKTRPTYAFIPEAFYGAEGFQKSRYLMSRWPGINCGANPNGVGSHVFPDPEKPVSIRSRCPILAEFLLRLETIAATKTIAAA